MTHKIKYGILGLWDFQTGKVWHSVKAIRRILRQEQSDGLYLLTCAQYHAQSLIAYTCSSDPMKPRKISKNPSFTVNTETSLDFKVDTAV